MVGMFDPSAGMDPLTMLLMGGAAGLGQAGATSRMPISAASVFGGLGGGLMAGQQAANQSQLQQQQTSEAALKNAVGLQAIQQQQAVMGQPIPSMQDIRSGRYQGLAPLFAKKYAEQQQRLQSPDLPMPSASAQQPGQSSVAPTSFLPPVYAPSSVAAKNIAGNNPGNIKTADGGWAAFPDMATGIDAIGNWLDRAQNVHGLTTVRQLIDDPVHGYAPSADPGNKGKMLPEVAANRIGIGVDDPVNMADPIMREKMTRAILQQEQGGGALSRGAAPRVQLAQYAPPQGQQMPSAQPAPDTSTPFDRLQDVMFERAQRSVTGLPLTQTEQMLMAAKLYPQGSPENKILMGQALKNSGIEPFKGGERPNAPLMEYDSQSGGYKVVNPAGYNEAVKGRAAAEAQGRGTIEPQTIVDPATGTPFATSRTNAFAPGAPPVQTGLSPGAHASAEAGGKQPVEQQNESFKAQTEAALAGNKPITLTPGETTNVNPQRVPFPTPMGGMPMPSPGPAAPQVTGPPGTVPRGSTSPLPMQSNVFPGPSGPISGPGPVLPPGMVDTPANRALIAQLPPGAPQLAGTAPPAPGPGPGAPTAPGAAQPSPGAGITLQGTPLSVAEEQKTTGTKIADLRQQNIAEGNAARMQQATLLSMKNDAPHIYQGPESDKVAALRSYLRLIGMADPEAVASFEDLTKNAGTLTRQAVKDTSPRAAVQEFKLINGALPNPDLSPKGFQRVTNEYMGLNDFRTAKVQAQEAWAQAHNNSVAGFEPDWQAKASPWAFIAMRMEPDDLAAWTNQVAAQKGGATELGLLKRQMQYIHDTGLEQFR